MFYSSVLPLDHGLLEFPTNAYGGFAYRANTLERPTTSGQQIPADPTKRFITEQNLALFWRRPGLYPRVVALPVPLLSTGDAYATGTVNRPPGMMRADCAPIRYRQRNLLAGELVQSDDSIRLWTINDSSDHKQLLHYKLRVPNAAGVRRDSLLRVDSRMGGEEDDEAHNAPLPFGRVELANEVLQLKAFVGQDHQLAPPSDGTGKVFLRSKNALLLADTIKNTVSTIFRSQTNAFTQIPHMDGELAVIDSRGMLFWGHIDSPGSFGRFKCPTLHKDICPTDCPRILVSIDEKEARLLDLRDANCAGQLLFTHSIGSELDNDGPFSDRFHASLVARDRLFHVHTMDIGLEAVLLTSNRRHTLIDLRMPGLTLLKMAHCEIDGADYSIMTSPFLDPGTGGHVFSLFSLTHIKKPALSHWSLMYHPNECVWSSIGPKYELDTPRAALTQYAQLHADKMPPLKHSADTALVPKYTRAIHYQPLDKKLTCASTHALLFRQMEGGEIWYENVLFDPLPKLRQDDRLRNGATEEEGDDDGGCCEGRFDMAPIDEAKMKAQCLTQIAEYQSRRKLLDKPNGTHFFAGVQDELMEFKLSKQGQTKRIDLTALEIASEIVYAEDYNVLAAVLSPAPSISSSTSLLSHASTGGYPFTTLHRVADECTVTMDEPQYDDFDEQFEGEREDKLFSISVSKIWHKTLARWQEARKARAQSELGLSKAVAGEKKEQWNNASDDEANNEEEEEEEEQEEEQEYEDEQFTF